MIEVHNLAGLRRALERPQTVVLLLEDGNGPTLPGGIETVAFCLRERHFSLQALEGYLTVPYGRARHWDFDGSATVRRRDPAGRNGGTVVMRLEERRRGPLRTTTFALAAAKHRRHWWSSWNGRRATELPCRADGWIDPNVTPPPVGDDGWGEICFVDTNGIHLAIPAIDTRGRVSWTLPREYRERDEEGMRTLFDVAYYMPLLGHPSHDRTNAYRSDWQPVTDSYPPVSDETEWLLDNGGVARLGVRTASEQWGIIEGLEAPVTRCMFLPPRPEPKVSVNFPARRVYSVIHATAPPRDAAENDGT